MSFTTIRKVSEGLTSNVQISTKLPSGVIVVVGGDDFDDFMLNLNATVGGDGAEQIAGDMAQALLSGWEPIKLPAAKQNIQRAMPVQDDYSDDPWAAEGRTTPAPARQPARRQSQGPRPGGSGRQCEHGGMVERTGNKNGKDWRGFFCPADRDDPTQCAPQFVR